MARGEKAEEFFIFRSALWRRHAAPDLHQQDHQAHPQQDMPDSRHACGLRLNNGMELLLHIGIDTVDMKGDGFKYLVQEGQTVSAGTPLIKFDRAKIKAAGHPDVTVCVITEEGNAQNIQLHTGIQVKAKETKVADWT